MLIDGHPTKWLRAHWDAAGGEVLLAYRKAQLLADYLRASAGLALAIMPLVAMQPAWPIAIGLVALVALFLVFLMQTWRRQHSRVLVRAGGIALVDGAERWLAWRDLDGLRLRWFGSRRQGRGWLELELHGAGQRLVLTSALEGFDGVVAEAVLAARENQLALEPATQANITAVLARAA